jgi:hypothetical protein
MYVQGEVGGEAKNTNNDKDENKLETEFSSMPHRYQCISSLAGVGNYFSDISTPNDGNTSETHNTYKDIVLNNISPDYDTISQVCDDYLLCIIVSIINLSYFYTIIQVERRGEGER